jgi:hypothetical protein
VTCRPPFIPIAALALSSGARQPPQLIKWQARVVLSQARAPSRDDDQPALELPARRSHSVSRPGAAARTRVHAQQNFAFGGRSTVAACTAILD